MELFDKAFSILQTEKFDRRRYMAARKLYHKAKGEEKMMIGQLFESQMALADTPEDVEWMASVP